jgi:Holliday junction resolvase RusA-like endonuclease
MKVKFSVLGEPRGKQRPRMTKEGHTYTPKETVQYENLIRMEYRRQCHDLKFCRETALDARIAAYYGIPKSASKKKRQAMLDHKIRPLKKVDVDNLVKVVLDSLNEIAYHDDVQVVDCQVRKFYSENPRVVVTIQEARGD